MLFLLAAVFGSIEIRLEEYGGVGDGETDNTDAFARAIGAIKVAGGGTLSVGPGSFVSFPFNLTSRLTLQLQANTVIIARTCAEALADPKWWPALPPLPNYGLDQDIGAASRYQSFVHAEDVEHVAIVGRGESSVIDGRGEDWWKAHLQGSLTVGRPHLVEVLRGTDFRIADLSLKNSPFWTLHPVAVRGVRVQRISVTTPLQGAPNTDGFDPDACTDVVIEDSSISTNDDCIAIKAGLNCFGSVYGPTSGVVVRNVTCVNAIVIGSEMSGGVRNVSISNSTGRLYFKTGLMRGGFMTDVVSDDVMVPANRGLGLGPQGYGIRISTSYGAKPAACNASWSPPPTRIERIGFRAVRGEEGLVLQNWSVYLDATHASMSGLHFADIDLPVALSGHGFVCDVSPDTAVAGDAVRVVPEACPALQRADSDSGSDSSRLTPSRSGRG